MIATTNSVLSFRQDFGKEKENLILNLQNVCPSNHNGVVKCYHTNMASLIVRGEFKD